MLCQEVVGKEKNGIYQINPYFSASDAFPFKQVLALREIAGILL
jgi:hypothetical protein